jgi:hypothetical protein
VVHLLQRFEEGMNHRVAETEDAQRKRQIEKMIKETGRHWTFAELFDTVPASKPPGYTQGMVENPYKSPVEHDEPVAPMRRGLLFDSRTRGLLTLLILLGPLLVAMLVALAFQAFAP